MCTLATTASVNLLSRRAFGLTRPVARYGGSRSSATVAPVRVLSAGHAPKPCPPYIPLSGCSQRSLHTSSSIRGAAAAQLAPVYTSSQPNTPIAFIDQGPSHHRFDWRKRRSSPFQSMNPTSKVRPKRPRRVSPQNEDLRPGEPFYDEVERYKNQ